MGFMAARRPAEGLHTPWVLAGLASILLWLAGPAPAPAQPEGGQGPAPVRVAPVLEREVRPYVRLIGTSRAVRRSLVASEVAGRVVAMEARRGERVDRNGTLARIDPTVIRLKLDEARARLQEARATHENLKLELERARTLLERKSISNREYDDARFEVSAAKSRIEALEAQVRTLEHDLNRCTIRAPFGGFVVEEHTELGQWVREGGTIAEMADIDPMLVGVPVPDRYVRWVSAGQELPLRFDGLGDGADRTGRVRSVVPEGNEEARTFPVEVLVPNPEGDLLAGMSCEVRIPVGEKEERLLVAKDALVAGEAGTFHLFAVREGKAQRVEVEKGQAYEGFVAVSGGVSEGEPVVVEGNERLFPGQPVRVVEE
jgi:RND family efflux transporter MFP subunit